MSAQTLNVAGMSPAELHRTMLQLAGMFDSPISRCAVSWGELTGDTRVLTLRVLDRLDKPFPPQLFADGRGREPGRWWIAGYLAESAFGAPVTPGFGAASKGRVISDALPGSWFLCQTDEGGVAEIPVEKAGAGSIFVHTAVIGLMQGGSGIDWASGASL